MGGSLDSGSVATGGFGDFCDGDVSHATTYSSGRCVRQATARSFAIFSATEHERSIGRSSTRIQPPPGVDASKGQATVRAPWLVML